MRDKKDFGCNIVLIGFMGAGKSTIARTLSERYGLEVVEPLKIVVLSCGGGEPLG